MESWNSYLITTALCASLGALGCAGDPDDARDTVKDTNPTATLDASKPDAAALDAGRDSGLARDATADLAKVSKPGEYAGYGERVYHGYELSSQYVAVRDGTQLAIDLYRPKESAARGHRAAAAGVWMHTPYNRRYFQATPAGTGIAGETYPGAAATPGRVRLRGRHRRLPRAVRVVRQELRATTAASGWTPRARCVRHHRVAGRAAVEHRQDRHVGLLGDRRQSAAGGHHRAASSAGRSSR